MRNTILSFFALASVVMGVACDTDLPTAPADLQKSFDIRDGVHQVGGVYGNEHFFWLPPMVRQVPIFSGDFDENADPTLRVWKWSDQFQDWVATPIRFDLSSGLRINNEKEWYGADWFVFEDGADAGDLFRISVQASGLRLGFADVMIVRKITRRMRRNLGEDYVLLSTRSGKKSLKIRFRLEEGVLPVLPGFAGISGAELCSPNADGCVSVSWLPPLDWSGYLGFKIYSVAPDESLTWLQDCPCSGPNCPDQITSCDVSGLDPGRTMRFYVRAYDEALNLTPVSDPLGSGMVARTGDVSAPVHASNLQAAWQLDPAGIDLGFNAAIDNQYSGEANTITYTIYRRAATTFSGASIGAGTPDGVLISTQGTLSYLDPAGGLTEAEEYFYTVCAQDSTEPLPNKSCDGNIKSVTVPGG